MLRGGTGFCGFVASFEAGRSVAQDDAALGRGEGVLFWGLEQAYAFVGW